jgi:hypothetical protein
MARKAAAVAVDMKTRAKAVLLGTVKTVIKTYK